MSATDIHAEKTQSTFRQTLPMIAKKLPDFGPIFERYAADLKTESER
jgi:hypothetical protein